MNSEKYHLSSVRASYGITLGVSIDELSIAAGVLHVLVGSNGSGKSTLLGVLAFLNKPDQGTISFEGVPVNWARKECAFLRQRVILLHQLPYLFSGSVASNVGFGLAARGVRKESAQEVISLLSKTAFSLN